MAKFLQRGLKFVEKTNQCTVMYQCDFKQLINAGNMERVLAYDLSQLHCHGPALLLRGTTIRYCRDTCPFSCVNTFFFSWGDSPQWALASTVTKFVFLRGLEL